MSASTRLASSLHGRTALVLLFAFGLSAPVQAQDAASETTTELEEITVEGARGEEDIVNIPAAVSSSGAEVVQDRFAGNPTQVLRATPGTFTRPYRPADARATAGRAAA